MYLKSDKLRSSLAMDKLKSVIYIWKEASKRSKTDK